MKVKLIIILIILLLFIDKSYSQTKKDTLITWISIPDYDSLGNLTIYKKTFNHIPTRKDTLSFKWRRNDYIKNKK